MSAASCRLGGVAHDAAVGRHRALHRAAQRVGRGHAAPCAARPDRSTPSTSGGASESTPAIAPVDSGPSLPATIARTTRRPNTRPSSSEFDASRLAPCTPLHAVSPHAHRCGKRRRAVEIGDDAARQVVRGRRDRQPVARRDRDRPSGTPPRSSGSGAAKSSIIVASSHRCSAPRRCHPSVDRARDDVARREVGERVHAGHERDAVVVAEDRALAAQRLREQRPRHRRVVQRRRVELHELEVGARDAGLQRQRDTVAGRQRRVRRDREALARRRRSRARRRRRARTRPRRRAAARARPCSGRARRAARSRTSPRAPRRRCRVDRGHERALDLGAGRVAAGVHDAGERVTALAGEQQLGRRRARARCRSGRRAPRARGRGRDPR